MNPHSLSLLFLLLCCLFIVSTVCGGTPRAVASNLDLTTGYEFDQVDVNQGTFKPLKSYGDYRLMGTITPGACTVDGYSKLLYVVAKNQTSSSPLHHVIHTIDAQSGSLFETWSFRDLSILSVEFDQVQSVLYAILWQVNNRTMDYQSVLIRFDPSSPSGSKYTTVATIPETVPVRGVSAYCDKKGIIYFFARGPNGNEWIKLDAIKGTILSRKVVSQEITSMGVITGRLYATVTSDRGETTALVELDRNTGTVSRSVVTFTGKKNVNGGAYIDLNNGIYYASVSSTDSPPTSHIARVDLKSGEYTVTPSLPKVALCLFDTL